MDLQDVFIRGKNLISHKRPYHKKKKPLNFKRTAVFS